MTPDDPRHGTYAGHRAGCDLDCCHTAWLAYLKRVYRLRGYGKWQPFVDAEPARQHTLQLIAGGMPLHHIAADAAVYPQLICRLIYGEPADGSPPTKRIRPENERAILAVTLRPSSAIVVDSTRTVALLRALAANGWTISRLQDDYLGTRTGLSYNMTRGVRRFRAEQVAELADKLAWQQGPSRRARQLAARNGWTTDALWSDLGTCDENVLQDVIDKVAVRRYADGYDVPITRPERVEVVRELLKRGVSHKKIMGRLHCNGTNIAALLAKVSRPDQTMDAPPQQEEGAA